MNENTTKLIEALAAKLGTTVEHLWNVLVRQAPISGAVDLMTCIALVAITVWWVFLVKRKTTRPPKTEDDRYADWEAYKVVAWASVAFAVLFVILLVCSAASIIVAAFVNPEYWALKQLIK